MQHSHSSVSPVNAHVTMPIADACVMRDSDTSMGMCHRTSMLWVVADEHVSEQAFAPHHYRSFR